MGDRRRFFGLVLSVTVASLAGGGCGTTEGLPLPNESTGPLPGDDYVLVARLAHVSDAHIIDEESPARLPFAKGVVPFAWRPYERYSAQLLDGIIRAINRHHEFENTIDFVVHTGDAVDNHQLNELRWFLDVFDGTMIAPRSGPDDRAPDRRSAPHLDAHAPFQAQGLYRRGVHGDGPSIPWYAVVGNHERFALGVFPVVPNLFGGICAPLPLANRIGLFLPPFLDPLSSVAYAPITPANPGLPLQPALPTAIQPNAVRRYYTRREYVAAHFDTVTGPSGHGFAADHPPRTWYSVSPVPGLRLVALDSSRPAVACPAGYYPEGALDAEQMAFLHNELAAADDRGELVMVLTHHPSHRIHWVYGSAVSTDEFRAILNRHPCVVAHLAGHMHRNRVRSHGGYVEIETASTLDYPQEGRIIEVFRGDRDVQLRYWVFSHLPDDEEAESTPDPGWAADPLREMRRVAFKLARDNPVIEGITPPRELIEGGVGAVTDVITGIGGDIISLGEELSEVTGELAGAVSEVVGPFPKAGVAVGGRMTGSGSPDDRAGTITLPRR